MKKENKLIVIGVFIFVTLLGYIFVHSKNTETTYHDSILSRIEDTKMMRVGYAAYPPYVVKDLTTGELSGYYIDIMNEMAGRMGVEIEWIETTWQTYITDLQTGKFDVLNDPMFTSIPRWEQISFTSPLGYFSGVAGIVKKNEYRFNNLDDLNQEGVKIAVPQGWTAQDYANKYLTKATIKSFPGDTATLAFADVVTGNSDVALVDGPSVQQYIEKNPNQNAKAMFLDNPSVITPAAWGVQKGDIEWLMFLNGSIDSMRTDGTLKKIAQEYHLYSYEIESTFVPQ